MTENITQNLSEVVDVFLSSPIAKNTYVYITKSEYDEIIRQIEQNDVLVDSIDSFKKACFTENNNEDTLAGPPSLQNMLEFCAIIEPITNTPWGSGLIMDIVFKYIKLNDPSL